MIRLLNSSWLFFVFVVMTYTSASSQNATDIVRRADQNMRGESSQAEMVMTIVRPTWQRSVSMKAWSKGNDYSLVYIQAPARDAGTAFLKRKNEIWNWVPNIGRTIKMPPSMMMQSWMGSDFTNDDLVKESSSVDDYTHRLLGKSTIAGSECYQLELIPKENAAIVWGKVIVWITQKDYLQLRAEFYDEKNKLINVMTGSDIKTFDGRKIPSKMEMTPVDKKGHKTIMEYKSLNFNRPIKDDFFSIANLRRVN